MKPCLCIVVFTVAGCSVDNPALMGNASDAANGSDALLFSDALPASDGDAGSSDGTQPPDGTLLPVDASSDASGADGAIVVDSASPDLVTPFLPRSCKELLAARPGLPDGAYQIDVDEGGLALPFYVWCDMTTDGGGWTALINPTGRGFPAWAISGLTSSSRELSGMQSCGGSTIPAAFTANGWWGIVAYACGSVTFTMSIRYPNPLGATDIMFVAAAQGVVSRALAVNGMPISEDAKADGHPGCAFWNGKGLKGEPAKNECWRTSLDVAPHIYKGKVAGEMKLDITVGPSGNPDGAYGAGANVQRLFLR